MDDWKDCYKFWPYRDYQGVWRWPNYTQRRVIGNLIEYRERVSTRDDQNDEAW